MNKQIKFLGEICNVTLGFYPNGRTAIRLTIAATDELMGVATVNLPDETLQDGYVFIKDWGENAGMLDALTEAGIVVPTGATVIAGHCKADICRLVGPTARPYGVVPRPPSPLANELGKTVEEIKESRGDKSE